MKCLDQNGVKYLWSLMMGNLQNKSNTGHTHDDRYFTESEITTKLSSKANYEEGTWTPVVRKGIVGEDITGECMVRGNYYFRVGEWVYITTSIVASSGSIPGTVEGLPFKIEGRYTPEYTSGFIITGENVNEVMPCKLLESENTRITFDYNKTLHYFTLSGWAKIVP